MKVFSKQTQMAPNWKDFNDSVTKVQIVYPL